MRIIKQADTVLLFNILPFDFTEDIKRNTLLFYEARTLHYSSLSPGVYALCAARLGEMELAERYFDLSVDMDLKDIKNESENGLHTPTSGEVYTIITQGYAGIFPNGDVLELSPHMPEDWDSLQFKYVWRGNVLTFKMNKHKAEISSKGQNTTLLRVKDKIITIAPENTLKVEY